MSTDSLQPDKSLAWAKLQDHLAELERNKLDEPETNSNRYEDYSVKLDDLLIDFSRINLNSNTLKLLEELAEECQVQEKIQQLFSGEQLNFTENRAALHSALRGTETEIEGLAEIIQKELDAFLNFADSVRDGLVTGSSGKKFQTIVNIGIGGSDLGPRLVSQALSKTNSLLDVFFVAGADGIELEHALVNADPEQTLFIVCSKSFDTRETHINAYAARSWLLEAFPEVIVAEHFAAVSANNSAMDDFGFKLDRRFKIWDWVGGRYSIWSAVGLSAAISIGSDAFRELLKGARDMDKHFLNAPFAENIPLLLGMVGIWNQNFLAKDTNIVLPYDHRLKILPSYLQQLFMESQGKTVQVNGRKVPVSTGIPLWGATGFDAQHSFSQWLHQGFSDAVVEFIGVVNKPLEKSDEGRLFSLANIMAQADTLFQGEDTSLPYKAHLGNRSSVLVILRQLNAYSLGALLAQYEHRVFVQSVVWGINPFDQWGVELGKKRASQFCDALIQANENKLPGVGQQILAWLNNQK
ncbi:MAG: glucose-6-phosphate isomerase [Pseudomonadota bacterium]|nr:glucose-6-phosphate isomerase [Pseudomonadota bacterium]